MKQSSTFVCRRHCSIDARKNSYFVFVKTPARSGRSRRRTRDHLSDIDGPNVQASALPHNSLNRKELFTLVSISSLTSYAWQCETNEAFAQLERDTLVEQTLFSRAFECAAPSVIAVGSSSSTSDGRFEAIASGIVWDKSGHIVTAYYPVKTFQQGRGSSTLQVALEDLEAGLVSLHPASTVAFEPSLGVMILKVDPPAVSLSHPPLKLVRSPKDQLRIGQDLLLVGSTGKGSRTCCVGCLSAINRSLTAPNGRVVDGLIQSDVKLESPLGFGGPLITNTGLLVGMPTITVWTKDPSKTGSGVNFAVPSDILADAVPKLIKYGNLSGRM